MKEERRAKRWTDVEERRKKERKRRKEGKRGREKERRDEISS